AGAPAGVHGALARRGGRASPGAWRGPGDRGDASCRAAPVAGVARISRRAAAAALSGDEILAMIQAPDIGKVIFEHTSDSYRIELPFGRTIHLPENWIVFGINLY